MSSNSELRRVRLLGGCLLTLFALSGQAPDALAARGAVLVRDIPDKSFPSELTAAGDRLFFQASGAATGRELWVSDGTRAGTHPVADIRPGRQSSDPEQLISYGNGVVFVAGDGVLGRELWRSDGTRAGTQLVAETKPGPAGGIEFLTQYAGGLFFVTGGGSTESAIWHSDGTAAGTAPFTTINSGGVSWVFAHGPVVYFTTDEGGFPSARSLWRTDGTAGGTEELGDIGGTGGFQWFGFAGGTLFTNGGDPYDSPTGQELWASDGTAAGTRLVADIAPGRRSSYPVRFRDLNGTMLFQATSPHRGDELWRSDGTAAGTSLVRDINPGPGSSNVNWFDYLGDRLYFVADDGADRDGHGYELWRTDGTTAGTRLVMDLRPGSKGSFPRWVEEVRGRLYFTVRNGPLSIGGGTTDTDLWRSDGTAEGTKLVDPIGKRAFGFDLVDVGGRLMFMVSLPDLDFELWASRR